MYQLQETLFDKLDSFGISYTDNQNSFIHMAIFDFQSVRMEDKTFKDTETTTRVGIHFPIFVSILSNFIQEPIFLCNLNPRDLVSSFIDALENLGRQSEV